MKFEVEGGCFGYSDKEYLFEEISFSVEDGDILAILGPNGAGKTTLLKCMMGLYKWKKGETKIDGIPIKSIPYRELWKTMGYVQQAKSMAFAYTVREMVLLGRGPHLGTFAQPGKKDMEIADEAIRIIGIEHLSGRLCSRISGGELQMVLIARALATKPQLLILDEPESNLDFKNQLVILDTITGLSKKENIACIINTHYPEHAVRIADKALLLKKSRKHCFGYASEIINEKNLMDIFHVNVKIKSFREEDREFKVIYPISLGRKDGGCIGA